jgi:uncharacterized UPF0146 family protein
MSSKIAQAASKARIILEGLGIQHSVGTSWDSAGTPIVVVDIPPSVDQGPVTRKLADVEADVVIRKATRSITAY